MVPNRRDFTLSKDQPILERARRSSRSKQRQRSEADFWRHFDLEKLARGWRPDRTNRALQE